MFSQFYFAYLFLLIYPAFSANTCYFPNGESSSDVPCDANALFTQCCGSRSACLTNGLCILEASNDTGINYARGTCTDKTWKSSLCPQQCQLNQDTPKNSSAYDFRTNGVQVWQCGSQGYAEEAKFCCESEAERQRCCSTEKAVFTLQGAVLGASTSASTTSTLLSASSARSSTFGPAVTSSSLSESASRSAPEITPTSMSTSPPISATEPAGSKGVNSKAIGIGAGVGGAVGLCILVAVIFFLVRRQKREKRKNELHALSISELHGEGSKPTFEVWTQPQELPSQAAPVWELSADPRTPRVTR